MGCGASTAATAAAATSMVPQGAYPKKAPNRGCCTTSGCSREHLLADEFDAAAGLSLSPGRADPTVILHLDENLRVVRADPSLLAFFGAEASPPKDGTSLSQSQDVSLADLLVGEHYKELAGCLLKELQMLAHLHLVQTQSAGESMAALLALLPAEQNWIAILHKVPKSCSLAGFHADMFLLPHMPDVHAVSPMLANANKTAIADLTTPRAEDNTGQQELEKLKSVDKDGMAGFVVLAMENSVPQVPSHRLTEDVGESSLRMPVPDVMDEACSANRSSSSDIAIPRNPGRHTLMISSNSQQENSSALPQSKLSESSNDSEPYFTREPEILFLGLAVQGDYQVNEPHRPSVYDGTETRGSFGCDDAAPSRACPAACAAMSAVHAEQPDESLLSLTDSWGVSTPSLEPGESCGQARVNSQGTQTDLAWVKEGWKCRKCSRPPRLPGPRLHWPRRNPHKRKSKSKKSKKTVGNFNGLWRLQEGPADASRWIHKLWISGKDVVTSMGTLMLEHRQGDVWLAGGKVWLSEDGYLHRSGKSGSRFVFIKLDPSDILDEDDHEGKPQWQQVTGSASSIRCSSEASLFGCAPRSEDSENRVVDNGHPSAEGLDYAIVDVSFTEAHPCSGHPASD
eukprot:TRINITY_DN10739_c0_g1_i1.p1 TRINITY_DN10739_c0_g1~~TRINITY_DN10739_c0_g1_i1.p1  ORF type:complete len:626 (-),score=89.46 TRINITY_DN10739_c0_g1_i1:422-2299(-)